MNPGPAYRTVDASVSMETVVLRRFGGEMGDPVAAWVMVSGRPVLEILAPATRDTWDSTNEDRFKAEVRELAARHELSGRKGPVTLLFDPPQTSLVAAKNIPEGESVDRKA